MLVVYVLSSDFSWVIYYVAGFVGCSQAFVLSTGINLISEVVGKKSSKGGFVFGFYSFIDKCLIGVAIYLVSNSEAYSNSYHS